MPAQDRNAPGPHFTNNFTGGNNNNNWSNGTQNNHRGRDFLQNTSTGQINVKNYGKDDYGKDGSDDEDEDEDRPLSPEKFQEELETFLRQYPACLDEKKLKKINVQDFLDKWQRIIISDLPGKDRLTPANKNKILDAMTQLSKFSNLSPKCLRIQDVGIEALHPVPPPSTTNIEVSRGKVGTQEVIVKALKESESGPDEATLNMLLRNAIAWRKLDHRNVLPFWGLYYLDESRSRICLVYPWMEHRSLDEDKPGKPEKEPGEYKKSAADSYNDFANGAIEGLKYLHSFPDAVHGDLHRGNFLIDPPDVARIADVGLAQLLSKATDKTQDFDKEQCACVLFKMYGGTGKALKNTPTRPDPNMSDEVWEVIEEWLKQSSSSQAEETEGPSQGGNK
ncbi:hypothetical protein PM082_013331 [Marasmius tenuissimus]|nr:hypothetical protein PM082_013331 [Marasmius tenuissimus]